MPVNLISAGGGTTTLTAASSASNYTITLPASTGTVVTTATLPASGKLLKATVMYNSTTRTTGTNSTFWGTIGGTNVYYNNAAMMSGSFTKQSATSIVVFHINFNIRGGINGHGIHGILFWKDTSVYWPFNEDVGNTSGSNNVSRGFVAVFTGLAVGSHTFYMSGTRSDTTAGQWALNPNQEGQSLALNLGQSTMIAYEIEV